MSRLMGQLFHDSPLLLWPLVSLTIFVLTFGAVVVAAFRRSAGDVAAASALPLGEDEPAGDQ